MQKTSYSRESPGSRLGSNSVSVVVPIFNEMENIPILVDRLFTTLDMIDRSFEIIAVNDGSTDRSAEELARAASLRPELKVIEFRRNAGQTAAIMAGIDYASGDIIVTIDADLQNDPQDIPLLLAKINEGFDVVSGWRKDRQDAAFRRNLVSRIANQLISFVSGVPLRDYGCTLKAYRKDMLLGMRLYGEMHRFVPIYASWMGARVVEIPVQHHAREFGKSKYGLNRTFKVMLDLLVVRQPASASPRTAIALPHTLTGALIGALTALPPRIELLPDVRWTVEPPAPPALVAGHAADAGRLGLAQQGHRVAAQVDRQADRRVDRVAARDRVVAGGPLGDAGPAPAAHAGAPSSEP